MCSKSDLIPFHLLVLISPISWLYGGLPWRGLRSRKLQLLECQCRWRGIGEANLFSDVPVFLQADKVMRSNGGLRACHPLTVVCLVWRAGRTLTSFTPVVM